MRKFSVLMSVYHREEGECLREALRSVFEQSAAPSQVVLVKDGPLTEDLDKVILDFTNKYSSLKVVALSENIGLGMALNTGLAQCSHELVARMDSDDVAVSKRFEKQLKVFENDESIDIVGGWIDEFTNDCSIIEKSRKVPEKHDEIAQFAKMRNPLNHMTVMFKRDSVLSVGGYQPFYLFEDYWLWARMLMNGCIFHNLQECLCLARGGVAMAARRGGFKYAKSEIKLQYKFLKMGFINIFIFIKNVSFRFFIRIMPNCLRSFIYKKILRK